MHWGSLCIIGNEYRVHEQYRTAEHEGCNWDMQMIDGCSLELCEVTLSVTPSGIALQN